MKPQEVAVPTSRITIREPRKCDQCLRDMEKGDRATEFGDDDLKLTVCESCDDKYRESIKGKTVEQRVQRLVDKYLPQ